MEHPIPQDVTGFQFKLIGEMTIKQFAYLASGVILAWITYSLPISFLIKLPLIMLFGGSGVALAFLPIEGRPLDTMILNFVKALFAPNQYLYEKMGGTLAFALPPHLALQQVQKPQKNLQAFLQSLPEKPKNAIDQKEATYLQSLSGITGPAALTPNPTPPQPFKKPMSVISQKPTPQVAAPQKETPPIQQPAPVSKLPVSIASEDRLTLLERQLAQIMAQKQQLEQQVQTLSQHLLNQKQPSVVAPLSQPVSAAIPQPVVQPTPVTKPATPTSTKSSFPFLIDVPNLIVGTVKDSRGNILTNILVEIKDKGGNPVRAFKTNSLGQFASATPLPNGEYKMIFEDTKGLHRFQDIEVEASGGILPPIEVVSTDAREDLRRELFGNPKTT